MELQQRLGLYQVFSRLYDNNRELLDEILKLENSENPFVANFQPRYVQAVLAGRATHLLTNLIHNQTLQLNQAQGIWLIGRDRNNAIPVLDKRLSRRHAAIQYLEGEGFFLIDLKSTNGTFLNGEPVQDRIALKDGDRIRLGSLAFSFFSSNTTCFVKQVPDDVIAQLAGEETNEEPVLSGPVTAGLESIDNDNLCEDEAWTEDKEWRDRDEAISEDSQQAIEEKDTSLFLRPKLFREDGEVLDRFLDGRTSRK